MEKWNFRRGRDWGNSGAPLPGHVFIDAIQGDDLQTGLDPDLPLKSITQAKALYPNSLTHFFVCAPGRYVDQYGSNLASGETYLVIGDSEDGDVIMEDSLGSRYGINRNMTENITLINYLDCLPSTNKTVINCEFIDCQTGQLNLMHGCRFINTPLSVLVFTNNWAKSCTFLNSPITFIGVGTLMEGCYVDASSAANVQTAVGNLLLNGNHFEDKTTWDVPPYAIYAPTNTDGDPHIYDIDLLNYTIDPVNSPLFGRGFPDGFSNPRHMARFYIGTGFYTGIPSFDAAIAANSNLDVVANELLNIGPNDIEFLETPEVTLDSLQALGIPHKVGIITYLSTVIGSVAALNSLNRTLEVRYSILDSGPLGAYKKYRFGEKMTNNNDDTPNGDENYDWGSNNPVFVKRFQIRIGVVKGGVI